jgi:hypothetical protein
VANYELVSICALWISDIVVPKKNSREVHPRIVKLETMDEVMGQLVALMDRTGQKLGEF